MARCIKMSLQLHTEVGLAAGHVVLDWDPALPPPSKGHSSPSPLFGPCLLWPNGHPSRQLLSSCFWTTICKKVCTMLSDCCLSCLWRCIVAKRFDGQDETWHAGRPRPWPHCVRWGHSSPPPKGHSPPIFGPYPLRPNGCI